MDDGTDRRYELIDGEPIAMTPPLFGHAIVQRNLVRRLDHALKPPCQVLPGAGVVPSEEAGDRYFVPDIAVTCAAVDPRGRYLTAPRVIIEILSPATSPHDRTVKLDGYREIARSRSWSPSTPSNAGSSTGGAPPTIGRCSI